jgi:hypothetical protein
VLRYGVAVHKIDVVDVVRFGEASTDLSDPGRRFDTAGTALQR